MFSSASRILSNSQASCPFSNHALWAPRIIQNLVEMGLDKGVWSVNSPESCFVTMCSVCGSCIVKTFDDGTDPDWNVDISDWSSFFG